ncbi:MAG: AAA family ATPase [Nitrospirota bacterium]|nr:AAA family ATPase [Nitrospirota bacterium]
MPDTTPHPLREGLARPAAYAHPVREPVRVLETHISLVFLTGEFAYKIKKPVDFGFLDYTSLAARRHCCEEEVRLNRRLAADLYLDVVPITGTPAAPIVAGDGEPIEYAVRMREFPQSAQMDRMLEAGLVTAGHVDRLADVLAAFHREATRARPEDGVGGEPQVRAAVMANFELTGRFVPKWIPSDRYARLKAWSEEALERLGGCIEQRLADGFVRECHGDAHLQNVVLLEDEPVLFDCIEFNRLFRFTDVMAEVAFTRMDLDARGRPDLGARLINRYLEDTGDYAGLVMLPLYLSYRAYVRAKVAALSPNAADQVATIRERVALSERYTRMRRPWLAIMHGVTGTGKTRYSTALVETFGAIRIRSDAERKRLAGIGRSAHPEAVDAGLYGPEQTAATYDRLHHLAGQALSAGFPVVLDATYLKQAQREAARQVAETLGVPFFILALHAPPRVLAARVTERQAAGQDLSDATTQVLDAQLHSVQDLSPAERERAVLLDTERDAPERLTAALGALLPEEAGAEAAG